MRNLIDLVENKNKNTTSAQNIYNLALQIATKLSSDSQFRNWNHEWSKLILEYIKESKKQHDDLEQSELEYDEKYIKRPFSLEDNLEQITGKWWDSVAKEAAYHICGDTNYELEEYYDSHPKVEMSDELTVLQNIDMQAKIICYKGSDTLNGMEIILKSIEEIAEPMLSTNLNFHRFMDFIKKVIPAILTITKLMGAKKSSKN